MKVWWLAWPRAAPSRATHWQAQAQARAQAQADLCGRAPGPADWGHPPGSCSPTVTPPRCWRGTSGPTCPLWTYGPGLVPFLPAGAGWRHSDSFDQALGGDARAYLDPAHHTAVVVTLQQ